MPNQRATFFSKDIDTLLFRDEYKRSNKFDIKKYLKNKPLPKKHISFVRDKAVYFELFREVLNEKFIGEASPSYLYSEVAAKEIYNYNKNAKIIIILRNPIERLISHYKMDISSGRQNEKNILRGVLEDYNKKVKDGGLITYILN